MDLGLGTGRARATRRATAQNEPARDLTGAAAWRTARSERAEATRSRLTRGGRAWRRDGGSRGCGVVVHVAIGATRLAPGACAGDAAIATQFDRGSRVSGSRAMPSRAPGGAGRARRATVVASVARPPVPRRLAIPGSPAADARARLSPGAVPREVSQDGGDVSSARDTRRGARVAARGSLRPRGITDEEWARQQRESNPNYRQFTQRAKDHIAAKGPMIGDMVRKNVSPPKPMPGQPPPEDKYLINMEMLFGRHPDMEEPKWRSMKQMSTRSSTECARRRGEDVPGVDPPQRNEKFPPKVFQTPLRPRRYVVTLKNDEVRWVDTVHEELDRAMRHYADAVSATWYTYHQKPDQNKFNSWQYLGSAVGGFVFLTGSIYLGIKRKHAIPTDAIQAIEFAQSARTPQGCAGGGHAGGRRWLGEHRRGSQRGDRLFEKPGVVQAPRRSPQGSAHGGRTGRGEDAHRQGHRGRGGGSVLLHVRVGVCGDHRRRRRRARARSLQARASQRALSHLRGRDRRAGHEARGGGDARDGGARADAQSASHGDGRVHAGHGGRLHRRHQPSRSARPGADAPRSIRSQKSPSPSLGSTRARRFCRFTSRSATSTRTSTPCSWRKSSGALRRRARQHLQRGGGGGGASRRRQDRDSRRDGSDRSRHQRSAPPHPQQG